VIRHRMLALVALALCALAPAPPGEAARGGALRSGAFEPARPEVEPKTLFSIRLVGAQSACDRSQAFLSQLSTPSPNPLPAGERAQDCIARA